MDADWIIVGAGFSGCTLAERIATEFGLRVLLLDRRSHLGGNAYDRPGPEGLPVHEYGPHIFHTNSAKVWAYLSRFTEWEPYFHFVRACVDGQKVPLPFNLNSLYALFPPRLAGRMENCLIDRFGFGASVPILQMKSITDGKDIVFLANYVYEKIFHNYTIKQWGVPPEQLDPSVTARVPIRVNRDDRYFRDVFQAMPRHGYTALFQNMVRHPDISVQLNVECSPTDIAAARVRHGVIYTGPIDALCGYQHGALPYRSLRFETATLDREWFQDCATVNYPNEYQFTRITELKHFYARRSASTTIVTEYPEDYHPGQNEPYYPVPHTANQDLAALYLKTLPQAFPNVVSCGRLADYRYYNMDQAVARALTIFEHNVVMRVNA